MDRMEMMLRRLSARRLALFERNPRLEAGGNHGNRNGNQTSNNNLPPRSLESTCASLAFFCEVLQSKTVSVEALLSGLDENDAKELQRLVTDGENALFRAIKDHVFRERGGENGLVVGYDVFLSHYKAQAGTECQLLKSTVAKCDPKLRLFLDSDDLKRLEELPNHVRLSNMFVLIMSPHSPSQSSSLERFGPISRPFCVVEIIVWYQNRAKIPFVLVNLTRDGYEQAKYPSSLAEVESIMDKKGWQTVARAVGYSNPQELLFEAVRLLSSSSAAIKRLEWHLAVENTDQAKTQFRDVLKSLGVDAAKIKAVSSIDGDVEAAASAVPHSTDRKGSSGAVAGQKTSVFLICSLSECAAEANLFVETTHSEFGGDIEISFLSGDPSSDTTALRNATFCIVFLSPAILGDQVALELIAKAQAFRCSLIPVEIGRYGMARFDYAASPSIVELSSGATVAFSKLKGTIAKPFTPHGSSDQVQLQLKSIWGGFGLQSLNNSLRQLPMVRSPFDVPMKKAKQFAPNTREWVFSQIQDWAQMHLEGEAGVGSGRRNNAFVIVGTAGLGKSVMMAEMTKRWCEPFKQRFFKANDVSEIPSQISDALAVVAVHFFKHDDIVMNSAFNCVGSVARQMGNLVEGFRSKLEESLSTMSADNFKQLETLVTKCWLDPAKASAERAKLERRTVQRYLILLDAMDECADKNEFIPILAKLLPEFPANYGFVITTRPDVQVPKLDKFDPIQLKQDDQKNREDVAAFFRFKLPMLRNDANTLKQLEENANGLFLYAMFACDQLLDRIAANKDLGNDVVASYVKTLPKGMGGLYVEFFDALKSKQFGNDLELYCTVLSPILAARVPLPESVWRDVILSSVKDYRSRWNGGSKIEKLSLESEFQEKIRGPLTRLLDFSGGYVAMIHKSMDDFLRGSDDAVKNKLAVDVDVGQEILAQNARIRLQPSLIDIPSVKGIQKLPEATVFHFSHGIYHLRMDGTTESIKFGFECLVNFDQLLRLVWAARSSYQNFLVDVKLFLAHLKAPEEIALLTLAYDILKLGESALVYDPRELAGQIYGRIGIPPFSQEQEYFSKQCQDWLKASKAMKNEDGTKLEIATPARFGFSGLTPASGPLMQIINHSTAVRSVAIGKSHMVTGCFDGNCYVYDVSDGTLVRTISGHSQAILSVALSVDNEFVFSSSWDATIRVSSIKTGSVYQVLSGHTSGVTGIAICPDNKRIVTCSGDSTCRLWDFHTAQSLRVYTGHGGGITCIAISQDGRRFYTGASDRCACVWDTESGALLTVFSGHEFPLYCIAISNDGSRIFTGSNDMTIRIWDAQTGATESILKGHTDGVQCLGVSSDGKRLVSGSMDKSVRIWDVSSAKEVASLAGHSDLVNAARFDSKNGNIVYTVSHDKTLRIWDVDKANQVRAPEGHRLNISAMELSQDGKRIFTASRDGSVRVWDIETGQVSKLSGSHDGLISAMLLSPDEKRLFTSAWNNNAQIWDVATGTVLHVLVGHTELISNLALSPNGDIIYTCSEDMTARSWDAKDGKPLVVYQGHTGSVSSVAFSNKDRSKSYVYSSSLDRTVHVWNPLNGEFVRSLVHDSRLDDILLSRDEKHMFTLSIPPKPTAYMWSLERNEILRTFSGSMFSPAMFIRKAQIELSTDERLLLISTDVDGECVWDIAQARCVDISQAWNVAFGNKKRIKVPAKGLHVLSTTTSSDLVGFTQDSECSSIFRRDNLIVSARTGTVQCWKV